MPDKIQIEGGVSYSLLFTRHPKSHAVANIRAVSGRLRPPQLPLAADTAAQGDLRTPPYLQCRGDLRTMYNALTAPDIADRSPRSDGV